jgi:hypothetical protein
MTSMGPLHYFLGLEINQDDLGINISQTKYARDFLVRFHDLEDPGTITKVQKDPKRS